MTTRERIGTAQHSSNLEEVPIEELGDVDIVRACGIAGVDNPLGLSIWRWRVGGDQRELSGIRRMLVERGHNDETVMAVLVHMNDDVCHPCSGRGYEVVPGTPMLSDDVCQSCRGTGRLAMNGREELVLVEVIEAQQRIVASDIMRRLNREMDL